VRVPKDRFFWCVSSPGKGGNSALAINKAKKEAIYNAYLDVLRRTQGMVITEYRGMSMKDLSAVRKALRAVNGSYAVVKNTIFKIALRETGFAAPDDLFTGPVAVALAHSDVAKVTKTMLSIKDQPLLMLKGAVMGQTVFRADQLEALSTMPTLEEARATLIGTLQSPATSFLALIGTPAQNLVQVLKAYSDKLQGGSDAA
jgi:large subunit ribosomal protein L10